MRNALVGAVCLLPLALGGGLRAGDTASWERETRQAIEAGRDQIGKRGWVGALKTWKGRYQDAKKRLADKSLKLDELTQPQIRLLSDLSLRLMHLAAWRG